MFALVNKAKYKELVSKCKQADQKELEEAYKIMAETTELVALRKENTTLREQVTKYKKMYADEVQKRIDLCEKLQDKTGA